MFHTQFILYVLISPRYQPPGSFDAFWKKGAVGSADTSRDKNGRRSNRGAGGSNVDSPAYGTLTKKKRKRGQGKDAAAGGQQGAETPKPKKDNKPKTVTNVPMDAAQSKAVEKTQEGKETDNTTDVQTAMDS